MAYSITRYNKQPLATVVDGTVDNSLDITLVGKNHSGYGQALNDDLVWLLEHFAYQNPPPRPILGQVWFDSTPTNLKLNVYFDETNKLWKTIAINNVSSTQPVSATLGDMWYDTTNNQLNVYNGSNYTMVGPQSVTGFAATQMQSVAITDNAIPSHAHAVQRAVVNGTTLFIVNADADFTPSPAIPGFPIIYSGVTINNSYEYHGTITNANKLGNNLPSFYAPLVDTVFPTLTKFPDEGIVIGTTLPVLTLSNSQYGPTVYAPDSNTLTLQNNAGAIQIIGGNILPTGLSSSNLGSNSLQFGTVYANTFTGTAAQSNLLNVSGYYRQASVGAPGLPTINTIVVRDGSGNINVNNISSANISANAVTAPNFYGNATTATNADHANSATSAVTADLALLVHWANIPDKPTNFVFNDNNTVTWNINISGETTGIHYGPTFGSLNGDLYSSNNILWFNYNAGTFGFNGAPIFGSFTGPLTGSVTGNVAGNITGSVHIATDHFQGNVVGNVTGNVTGNVAGNVTGAVHTATDHFQGNVVGNVTGNLTGNVTGNVTGNTTGLHTGNVTGNVTGNLFGNADTASNSVNAAHLFLNQTAGVGTYYLLGASEVGTAFPGQNESIYNTGLSFNVQNGTLTATTFSGTLQGDSYGTHRGAVIGDVTGNVTGNVSGNAGSANVLNTSGVIGPEDNSTYEPRNELTLRGVYNNPGYPTTYGNLITLGGGGGGELLVGWSGSTGAHSDNFIRSRRDTGTTWSPWAKILTDVNFGNTLARVAATGDYNDLSNTPSIPRQIASPQAQLQNIVQTIVGSIDLYTAYSSSSSSTTSGFGSGWGTTITNATLSEYGTTGTVTFTVDLGSYLGLSNDSNNLRWKGNYDLNVMASLSNIYDARISYYGLSPAQWSVSVTPSSYDRNSYYYGFFTIYLTISGDHWYHGTSITAGWIGIGSRTNNVYNP